MVDCWILFGVGCLGGLVVCILCHVVWLDYCWLFGLGVCGWYLGWIPGLWMVLLVCVLG